ncbi:monovalent cation/H+ antiporter complex subunit F [Alkalilimnicola ehrlichii]|uniref:monovalent cation/H+ antiporter complex subunit F n=1 Tax=Alkalilimnicola ehrlichii TaxID=351052 RepID=UPI002696A97F|nr:monovalent cation/H+ antiporter complex subunit F [Alkalilimnicola ehrlichii]
MLSAQLFGTTGIAMILVLGVASGERAAFDVALVLALLALLVVLAFVHRLREAVASAGEDER